MDTITLHSSTAVATKRTGAKKRLSRRPSRRPRSHTTGRDMDERCAVLAVFVPLSPVACSSSINRECSR
mgnify:CR=1 FL=1